MAGYIPAPDDQFNTFVVETFVPYFTANVVALNFTAADATIVTNKKTTWSYAFTAQQNAEHAYRSTTEDKDAARADMEETIRGYVNKIQADPTITAAQKEALGIPVHKTTRTAVPVPSTTPAMQRIDTSTRAILRLFIVDATTPESRAKPFGVRGVEIREQIGGTAPTNPNNMAFLATETRPPYRADFDPEDVGKTVYFALRWVNTRMEPGPWSQIYSAVVPS